MQACLFCLCYTACVTQPHCLPWNIWQRFVDRTVVGKTVFEFFSMMRSCSTCGFLYLGRCYRYACHRHKQSVIFFCVWSKWFRLLSKFRFEICCCGILFFCNKYQFQFAMNGFVHTHTQCRLLLLLWSQNHWLFHSAAAMWLHIVSFCPLKL